MINISDDEDLRTAYEVALADLEGNLKFVIGSKKKSKKTVAKKASVPKKKETKAKAPKKACADKEDCKKIQP